MELLQTDENYPFDSIKLLNPKPLQGGTYLSKLECNENSIVFQTPKCNTKKGITQTEKKVYCDLLFTENDNLFINWLNMFSEKIRRLILEKKDIWFLEEDDMTLEDIEYNWIDSLKSYKKKYLLRTFIAKKKNIIDTIKVYSDKQEEMRLQDIDNESNLITILEVVGLKFSATSFHLEFNLRQIMVLTNKPVFDKCLIKINNNSKKEDEEVEREEKNVKDEEVEKLVASEKLEDDNIDIALLPITERKRLEKQYYKEEEVVKEEEENVKEQENVLEGIKLKNETFEDDTTSQEKKINIQNEEHNEEKNKEMEVEDENKVVKLESNTLDKNNKLNDLDEFILEIPQEDDSMKLKDQHQVYLDIYRQAREKAKKARQEAIKAYLTAKKIKQQYLLDEVETSDDEWDEEEVDLGEN